MHFRTQDAYVNATQWHKQGDHPDVKPYINQLTGGNDEDSKEWGWIPDELCYSKSGYRDYVGIDSTLKSGLIVKPGDWIIAENPTRIQGDPHFYWIYDREKSFTKNHECYEPPTKEDIIPLKAKHLWYVNYNGHDCPVYDFPTRFNMEKENGNTNHYWVLWGDRFYPYGDRFTHRICHTFVFKEYNSAKLKWDDMRTSRGIHVTILANDKPILDFACGGDMGYAMARAQYMIVKMSEHSYNFYNIEENEGKLIYYYNLPAKIKNKSTPGEIAIIPDYVEGWTKESWWKEYHNRSIRKPYVNSDNEDFESDNEDFQESQNDEYINWGSALSDQNIWWHRAEDEKPDQDKPGALPASVS